MSAENKIQRISYLIFRSIHSSLSDEERQELDAWRRESPENEELYGRLTGQNFSTEDYERYRQVRETDDWMMLRKKLYASRKSIFSLKWYLRYAAVLCIGIVASYWLWFSGETKEFPEITVVQQYETPSENLRAVLELANGETIELNKDQAVDEKRLKELGIVQGKSSIAYMDKDSSCVENHVLRVPRGGEYILVLSDNTKVWINSESELHYPSSFSGVERRVYIEGEAYFQVAKNASRPFVVETAGMDVRVTGTEFNVMAYKDKDRIETTLVEGCVIVDAGGKVVKMSPNMQAVFSKEDQLLTTRVVRANLFSSWKDGIFEFDNLPLREIVDQLGRWYNVDFVFEDESLREIYFTGAAEKMKPITFILDLIKDTRVMNYQIDGKIITIKKK